MLYNDINICLYSYYKPCVCISDTLKRFSQAFKLWRIKKYDFFLWAGHLRLGSFEDMT